MTTITLSLLALLIVLATAGRLVENWYIRELRKAGNNDYGNGDDGTIN